MLMVTGCDWSMETFTFVKFSYYITLAISQLISGRAKNSFQRLLRLRMLNLTAWQHNLNKSYDIVINEELQSRIKNNF